MEEVVRSHMEMCVAQCAYILPYLQHSTSSRTDHSLDAGPDATEDGATTGSSKVRFQRTLSLSPGHDWQLSTHLFSLVARTRACHVNVGHNEVLRLRGLSRNVESSWWYNYPRS